MRRFLFGILLCIVAGCGDSKKDQLIMLDQVPQTMMQVAKEKLPDVEFDQGLKRADGTFEVRGKDKQGKVRDIDFSANGEILEIE